MLAELVEEALKSGRRVRFRASGASMRPAIRGGDLITVAPVPIEDLAVGDIVLSRVGPKLTAHRIVAIERLPSSGGGPPSPRFLLRGDAAAVDDLPLPAERVIGRVVAVERKPCVLASRIIHGSRRERIERWVSILRRRIPTLFRKVP
ncbi:MAG: hypothetical protein WHT06_12475 [Desulfobacterales bacterium]